MQAISLHYDSVRRTDELVMESDPVKLTEIAKELARCGRKISGATFEANEMRLAIVRDDSLSEKHYAALSNAAMD